MSPDPHERRSAEEHSPGTPESARRESWLGAGAAAVTLAALAYAAVIFHGVAPPRAVPATEWWQPRGFLLGSFLAQSSARHIVLGIAVITLPVTLVAITVFALTRSALVRTLNVATVLATGLFVFYGLRDPGPQIWTFFHWRGSAVIVAMALVSAVAGMAPLLTTSWARRGWVLRLLVYVPLAIAVIAAQRAFTGTDPTLPFSISPWPVITVFGLDVVGTVVTGLLACVALGSASFAMRRTRFVVSALGMIAAFAIVLGWIHLRLGLGLPLLGTALGIGALVLGLASFAEGGLEAGLRRPGAMTAASALLLGLPLFIGEAWIQLDYHETRDVRAQRIIDALDSFYQRELIYPEELRELVESRDLDRVPRPRIGFAFLGPPEFVYQNFGTDYILEFSAPGWVQCAYNPPWQDDGEDDLFGSADEDDLPDAEEDARLPGAWSCPMKPPTLW